MKFPLLNIDGVKASSIEISDKLNINQKIKARFQKGEILAQILKKTDED